MNLCIGCKHESYRSSYTKDDGNQYIMTWFTNPETSSSVKLFSSKYPNTWVWSDTTISSKTSFGSKSSIGMPII